MDKKLLQGFLLAGAGMLAVVMIGGAVLKKGPKDGVSNAPDQIAQEQQYPHRDMLEDTILSQPQADIVIPTPKKGTLTIDETDFTAQDKIPREYTCTGRNISPALSWSGAPRGTESFVVLFEKKTAEDARILQWGVYNIPPGQKSLPAALARVADNGVAQARNYLGDIGYAGPCRSQGQDSFSLRIIALSKKPDLPAGMTGQELSQSIRDHVLDSAEKNLVYFYRM